MVLQSLLLRLVLLQLADYLGYPFLLALHFALRRNLPILKTLNILLQLDYVALNLVQGFSFHHYLGLSSFVLFFDHLVGTLQLRDSVLGLDQLVFIGRKLTSDLFQFFTVARVVLKLGELLQKSLYVSVHGNFGLRRGEPHFHQRTPWEKHLSFVGHCSDFFLFGYLSSYFGVLHQNTLVEGLMDQKLNLLLRKAAFGWDYEFLQHNHFVREVEAGRQNGQVGGVGHIRVQPLEWKNSDFVALKLFVEFNKGLNLVLFFDDDSEELLEKDLFDRHQ